MHWCFLSVFHEEIFESSNAFSLLNSVRKEDFRVRSRLAAVFPLLSFSSVRNLHPPPSLAIIRGGKRRKIEKVFPPKFVNSE